MKKISILILTLLVAMAACKKVPEVNKEYVDVERDLITVGTITATIQCDYEYITTLKKAYLYYGEGEDATDMNVAEMSVVQKTLYVELGGLKGNTTYSYYYEFVNGFNSMKSAVKAFKTEASSTTVTLPTVVTAEVTEITANSAKGGGEVTNDGGTEVTERGICWSTNENPTLNGNHFASGTGVGAFTALLSGLEANTTYHVRAYATNEKGTAYGLDKEFTTIVGGGSGAPEGAINGLFTINENGDQVYFSQGNLQYQASTNTWRFAENQFSFVGGLDYQTGVEWGNLYENGVKCDNALLSSTYNGWIDLFGWGTSGYHDDNDPYNIHYQPWEAENYLVNSQYNWCGFGPSTNMPSPNLTGSSANYDWGVYNAIINGGNVANQWRTLSKEEWEYIINYRNTISGVRYAKCMVDGYESLILLPDNWNSSLYDLHDVNSSTASFNSNIITLAAWEGIFANEGTVLLLATGVRCYDDISYSDVVYCRNGIQNGGDLLSYWTATFSDGVPNVAFCFYFTDYWGGPNCRCDRATGRSVRLVHDAH